MATEITFEALGLKELVGRVNREGSSGARMVINEGLRMIGKLFVPVSGGRWPAPSRGA